MKKVVKATKVEMEDMVADIAMLLLLKLKYLLSKPQSNR
jgi:hypothetical protein